MAANEKKYRITIEADGAKALREVEKVRKELAKAGTPNPTDAQVSDRLRQNIINRQAQQAERAEKAARAREIRNEQQRLADVQMFGERRAKALERARARAEKGPGIIQSYLENKGLSGGQAGAIGSAGRVAAGLGVVAAGASVAATSMKEIRDGDVGGVAGVSGALVKSIPVLGAAAENLIEAVTGWQSSAERMKRMSERSEQFMRDQLAHQSQVATGRMSREARESGAQQTIGQIKSRGEAREALAIGAELDQATRGADIEQRKATDEEKAKYAEGRKEMDAQRSRLLNKGDNRTAEDEQELADLHSKLKKMEDNHQERLSEISADGDQKRASAKAVAAEKAIQWQIEREKRIESETKSHQTRMAQAEAGRQAMNGSRLGGQIGEIDAEYKGSEQGIQEKYRDRIKESEDNPAQVRKLEEMRDAEIASAQKDRDAKKEQAMREERLAVAENQRELLSDQASFQAQQQRLSGQGFAAELTLTKAAYDRKKAEIDEWEAEQLRQNPQRAAQIKAQAEAQRKLAGQEGNEARRQAAEGEYGRRAGVQSALAGQMGATLAQQAKMGVSGAYMAGEKLKIKQEYAQRREELRKLADDPTLKDAERKQATGMLAGLGAEEAKATKMAGYRGPSSGLAASDDSGYGTGLAAAASEKSQNGIDRVAAASEETVKKLDELIALMAANSQPLQYAGVV